MVDTLPYGSWPSPLSAAAAAAAAPRLEGAAFVGDEIWWGEAIADEGARIAVRRRTASGEITTVLPDPWNARSRVHEYGGGSWAANPDGVLFFVEKSDQRVWALAPGAEPAPLTFDEGDVRYGGLTWQEGLLLAVREAHGDTPVPRRSIVAISTEGDGAHELVAGSDFVAQPSVSPGGERLAWVAWDHPDMPWDRTRLMVGRLSPEGVVDQAPVSSGTSAALQPEWTSGDELIYVDEPDGRWNLRRLRVDRAGATAEPIAPVDADTGGPLWVLGIRWFAPLTDGRIVAVRTHGADELVIIDRGGDARRLDVPVQGRAVVEDADGSRVLISGSGQGVSGIWLVDADGQTEMVRGGGFDGGEAWLPQGRPVTYPGPHGPVHAFDFAPSHPDAVGPAAELPPYLVWVHGGPTAHVSGVADSKVAYFTSRGIGVLDVNYGGSTGYGRAYRERLRGQWGVVDVDDVVAAARGLADEGRADPERIAIEGGSAGGWTVLAALVGSDVFGAGVSRYGVGDARALAADTHDFEARYLDGLIGPLPESEQVYVDRSPLTRADRFRVPLLLLQGADDAVVPPAQSEAIRDALAARGVPHAYVLYEGEGHGFRRAETIIHALEAELAFLGQVFGFETPDVPSLPME
jgi:dipeptidyl aminopeptidase/acylaminoacyl peptidase